MQQQIVVIHGGNTYDTYEEYLEYLKNYVIDDISQIRKKDWKVGLEDKLGGNYSVLMPTMPNNKNAKYLEWEIWFNKIIPFIQDGVILVGHSLGATFLFKYLSEQVLDKKVKATVFIAGVYDDSVFEESLGDFKKPDSFKGFIDQAGKVSVFHSKDDQVVPFSQTQILREMIGEYDLHEFNERGHFNQEEFPELAEKIKELSS